MAIIKTRRINNFTTVSNELINDANLSYKDLGLLIYLLSKPEAWEVRVDAIAKERGVGKDGIYSALKNLRECGYADYVRFSSGVTEWTIYDVPQQASQILKSIDENDPNKETPDWETPDGENPNWEKPDVLVKKEFNKRLISSKEITTVKERCTPGSKTEPGSLKNESITSEAWESYSKTYFNRYGVDPIRNAKISGQLSQFVARVGKMEAPHIAAFYVTHNNHFYVQKMHAVGMLLADAEKLRTEWVTNRQMTNVQAKQTDKTQARGNIFNKLIEEARANATK